MAFLAARNRPRLDGFQRWLFRPGMEFQAVDKWWGDHGRRAAPHEGLDLFAFVDADGRVQPLDRQTQIPAAFAGCVTAIQTDFLGKSIFIRHDRIADGDRRLVSAYGHVVPREPLEIGQPVEAGEVIGTLAKVSGPTADLAPHLHLTFAWAPADLPPEGLNWKSLSCHPKITLINPLAVILSRP